MTKFTSVLTVVLFSLLALQGNEVFAQAKKQEPAKPAAGKPTAGKPAPSATAPKAPGDEKLDISDLEQKYWAPKDSDFSVVQNRTYTKEKRFAVSLIAGPALNDVYSEGLQYAVVGNYFWNERYGVELSFFDYALDDSSATTFFKEGLSGGGTAPDFNRLKSQTSVGFNWVPFYAKMSLLGNKIIYFDMMITPSIGQISYTQQTDEGVDDPTQTSFAYGLDITQLFFLHKNFAIRVDLKNRWYSEDIVNFDDGQPNRRKSSNYSSLMFGGTFFF